MIWCKIESVLFDIKLANSARTELDGEGLCFGLTARGISNHLVTQEAQISSFLCLLKSVACWPNDSCFTSVQVSRGSTSTHRDTGNFDDSCTFSVSGFVGGDLIEHPFRSEILDPLDDDLLLALELECTNSFEVVAQLRKKTELMITILWHDSLKAKVALVQNPLQRVVNVPFLQLLFEKSGYLHFDPSLSEDINGFFLLGHLPPPGPDSRPRIQSRLGSISIEDLVLSRGERNRKLVNSMRPSDWDDDLMDLAIEEASLGCNSEPRMLTHEDMLVYTLCRRIPVREERASGWRTRAVDGKTEAGINPATVQDHATVYDDISKLDTMSKFCLERSASFTLWKRDMSKAFLKVVISRLHLKFAASIFCWATPT